MNFLSRTFYRDILNKNLSKNCCSEQQFSLKLLSILSKTAFNYYKYCQQKLTVFFILEHKKKDRRMGKNMFENLRFNRGHAADYLGVSVVTIDRALAKRKISCFRIGRRVIFSKEHLDNFLCRNEAKAKGFCKQQKEIN